MKRIFFLALIVFTISSLAMVENVAPAQAKNEPYSLKVAGYKVIVVSPLDNKRSVLIGVQKIGQKNTDSYLAEGVIALAISRLAKMSAEKDTNSLVKRYAKEMTDARTLALKLAKKR